MKPAIKTLVIVNLLLTMIYVAGVDSLSTSNVIIYGLMLAGLWWLTELTAMERNETKEERK